MAEWYVLSRNTDMDLLFYLPQNNHPCHSELLSQHHGKDQEGSFLFRNETQRAGCNAGQSNSRKSKDLTLNINLTSPCFSGRTAETTQRRGYKLWCTGKKYGETQKTASWQRQNKPRHHTSDFDYLPQLLRSIRIQDYSDKNLTFHFTKDSGLLVQQYENIDAFHFLWKQVLILIFQKGMYVSMSRGYYFKWKARLKFFFCFLEDLN